MSYITDFLPQYRELNTLFARAADGGQVGYTEQQTITEFWNKHNDIKSFEKMVLSIVLEKDKPTSELLLSGIKTEVEYCIRLYELSKEYLNGIDTEKICKERASRYDYAIKTQLEVVNEYSQELSKVNGSLDAIGFREHTPQEEERLWQQHDYLTKHYSEEKEKLTALYNQQTQAQCEATKYKQNLFETIYNLSIAFLKIVDCYLIPDTPSEKEETEIVEVEINDVAPVSVQEIDPDTIFRRGMFKKLQTLEHKLIQDKYINTDLNWVSIHENGKTDIKRLVTFLTGLVENSYFLPNRDPKIKAFFEARYHIIIGQNFEKSRRKPLIKEYGMVFYDYPF